MDQRHILQCFKYGEASLMAFQWRLSQSSIVITIGTSNVSKYINVFLKTHSKRNQTRYATPSTRAHCRLVIHLSIILKCPVLCPVLY